MTSKAFAMHCLGEQETFMQSFLHLPHMKTDCIDYLVLEHYIVVLRVDQTLISCFYTTFGRRLVAGLITDNANNIKGLKFYH